MNKYSTFNIRKRGLAIDINEAECKAAISSISKVVTAGNFYEFMEQSPEICCEICMKAFLLRNPHLSWGLIIKRKDAENRCPFVQNLIDRNNA